MVRRTARHVAAMESSDADDVWRVSGMEHVVLTTIGRRSGEVHKVALAIWREPDGSAIVAGSANGEDRHPAWFLNLRDRNEPEILCRTQRSRFWSDPEILEGDEYDRVWRLLVDDRPFFDDYAKQIDRKIPLVRLRETRPAS
jgi:deazaflavin-dependent oxidoreductase (nitroreductase family)